MTHWQRSVVPPDHQTRSECRHLRAANRVAYGFVIFKHMETNMSTGSTARFGMSTYVAVIFVIGLVIAGTYVFVFTPGETTNPPAAADAVGTSG